jgi:hypothetical protein
LPLVVALDWERIVMGALVVTCPHTQKKFSTGVQIDADSFLLVEFNALVVAYCPHCEQEHSWHYRDAEYVDVIAPEHWVENREAS